MLARLLTLMSFTAKPTALPEYVAGSEATKEALNLRMLLERLGFGDPRALARTYTNTSKQPVNAQTDRN